MPNQGISGQNAIYSMKTAEENFFIKKLTHWNSTSNGRKMPWKGEKNPYRIWLSEIILQQTRVQQGLEYYNRFIKNYPTINDLASAPEADVFKLWEGLGYYRRCKNMLAAAAEIVEKMDGKFPDTFETIQALKGVGPYTSAAIASFAFNLPHAVLDGNVYRLLARYFGISQSIDSAAGKKYFALLAEELLDKKKPGLYNQAIMDFGALICKPLPECMICPLQSKCVALKENTIRLFPVKDKKKERTARWFYYIIAEYDDGFYIRMRDKKDIWQNLHEFYLLKFAEQIADETIFSEVQELFPDASVLDLSKQYGQHLTHQTIRGKFIHIRLQNPASLHGFIYLTKADLRKIAFPRYITTYFQESRILN